MGAAVTFGAVFKALMNGFAMGRLMAFLTFRYLSMFVMAEGTVFGSMSGSAGNQSVELLLMARGAEILRFLTVEYDK